MGKIFLLIGTKGKAAIVVARDANDIGNQSIGDGNLSIHEIGLAHPDTPLGCLLSAEHADITRVRPLGSKVT